MEKYCCSVCGFEYDPVKGDPDVEVEPGTAFCDLPEEWRCPRCRAMQVAFKKTDG